MFYAPYLQVHSFIHSFIFSFRIFSEAFSTRSGQLMQLVERTGDLKVTSSNPGKRAGEKSYPHLSVCALIRCPLHHPVTAVARERPWPFWQSATFTQTSKVGVGWLYCPRMCGNTRPLSSQLRWNSLLWTSTGTAVSCRCKSVSAVPSRAAQDGLDTDRGPFSNERNGKRSSYWAALIRARVWAHAPVLKNTGLENSR